MSPSNEFEDDQRLDSPTFQKTGDSFQPKWILPYRDSSGCRGLGWGLIGIGTLGSLFLCFWISGPASWGLDLVLRHKSPLGWLFVAFGCLGFIGLYQSLRLLVLGVLVLQSKTRSEISLNNKQISYKELIGWFPWRLKYPTSDIQSLSIDSFSARSLDSHEEVRMPTFLIGQIPEEDQYALTIHFTNSKRRPLAIMYNKQMLIHLAESVESSLQDLKIISINQKIVDYPDTPIGSSKANQGEEQYIGESLEEETKTAEIPAMHSKPSNSKIVEHLAEGGVTYEVPSQGFKGAPLFLMIFGIIWSILSLVIVVAYVSSLIRNAPNVDVFTGIVPFIFLLFGITITVIAYSIIKTKHLFGFFGDQFFHKKISLFGQRFQEYSAENIYQFKVGYSNITVNNKRLLELKFEFKNTDPIGVLAGREEPELYWLAEQLNRHLGIDPNQNGQLLRHDYRNFLASGSNHDSVPIPTDRIEILPNKPNPDSVTIKLHKKTILNSLAASLPLGIAAIGFLVAAPFVFQQTVPFGIIMCVASFVFFTIAYIVFSVARFSFEITVSSERLEIKRTGVFGSYEKVWPVENIGLVNIADTGAKINNQTVWQLRIEGDPNWSLMNSWKPEEIGFVAAQINQTMEIGKKK